MLQLIIQKLLLLFGKLMLLLEVLGWFRSLRYLWLLSSLFNGNQLGIVTIDA
jgi:hypothetical protein